MSIMVARRAIGAVISVLAGLVLLANIGDSEHALYRALTTISEDVFRLVLSLIAIAIAIVIVLWDRFERSRTAPQAIHGGPGGAGGSASAGDGGEAYGGQGGAGGSVSHGGFVPGGEGGESGYMEWRRRNPDQINPMTDALLMQAGRGGRGGDGASPTSPVDDGADT